MAAPCTQTISLKEDLLFSRNYDSHLPFFKIFLVYPGLFLLPFITDDTWPPFLQQYGKVCPYCLVL